MMTSVILGLTPDTRQMPEISIGPDAARSPLVQPTSTPKIIQRPHFPIAHPLTLENVIFCYLKSYKK